MPTVLRKDGFKVIIYFDDHLPAHVHVISGDSEVKIDLGSLAHRVHPSFADLRTALIPNPSPQRRREPEFKVPRP